MPCSSAPHAANAIVRAGRCPAFAASAANTLDEQLDLERDLMRAAGQTHDYQEGVKAFLEKRQPEYKGE